MGVWNQRTNFDPLNKLITGYDKDADKALEKTAIQFMTWANNGSPREPRKPPIRYGVLRGSSSAFVGSRHVGDFMQTVRPGGEERPTPNQSYSADAKTITIGWNSEYAAKMHEWEGDWGDFTEQDGDAGNKWAEKHAQNDKNLISAMLADELGKNMGTK